MNLEFNGTIYLNKKNSQYAGSSITPINYFALSLTANNNINNMTNNNNNNSNMSTPNKKNSKTKNEENCSTGGPLVTYETSGEGNFFYFTNFFS